MKRIEKMTQKSTLDVYLMCASAEESLLVKHQISFVCSSTRLFFGNCCVVYGLKWFSWWAAMAYFSCEVQWIYFWGIVRNRAFWSLFFNARNRMLIIHNWSFLLEVFYWHILVTSPRMFIKDLFFWLNIFLLVNRAVVFLHLKIEWHGCRTGRSLTGFRIG